MLYRILAPAFLLTLAALAQQPNCTGITLDVDARCACVKDPKSDTCALVKKGFYENRDLPKEMMDNWNKLNTQPPITRPVTPQQPTPQQAQTARPRQTRVVPLTHKDYLRFLHPNAQVAAGIDFEKLSQSPELVAGMFGQGESPEAQRKLLGAIKEMDHLWISVVAPTDVVILMTGKFEQGVTANMFYSQGAQPIFLGGPHAMLIGSEPSMQAALDRLSRPAPANSGGWVTRSARALAKDHETWIATEVPPTVAKAANASSILSGIHQFAFGVRLSTPARIDGELVADSEANGEKIAAWVDHLKTAIHEKTGVGVLDSLKVDRAGASLRFAAIDDGLMSSEAGKNAMNSDLGVELYGLISAGFPGGATPRTVAKDKLMTVTAGMRRDEVIALLGQPLTKASIQGLDTPRETWTYQIPFGRQLTLRLDDGVVTGPPR